jgi:hypothetical protein
MIIDRRELYNANGWRIEGVIDHDLDAHPGESDCYSAEDIAAWKADRWQYVNVGARVYLHGVLLGEDWLGGVESGQLAEVECDPFELVPAEYGEVQGMRSVTMPSAMTGVVLEAVAEARAFLDKITGARPELAAIERTFDPNNPEGGEAS